MSRYLAVDLDAHAGVETIVVTELPLSDVEITEVLNGPTEMTATISPVPASLIDERGRSRLVPWRTAIFYDDGEELRGGILQDEGTKLTGRDWSLEISGYLSYPVGMPYTESYTRTDIDAFAAFREIWRHLQAQPGGKLNVAVDQGNSGKLIGRMVAQGEFDTENGPISFEYEPVSYRWWETDDLGAEQTKLAEGTPFEFWEEHRWSSDGESIVHRIRMAYPARSSVRSDVRFALGENVNVESWESLEYASEILALGAGEGSARIKAQVVRPGESRIRRVRVSDDASARTASAARSVGQAEIKNYLGDITVTEIESILGHEHEFDSLVPGDIVRLYGTIETDQTSQEVDFSVRVVTITRSHSTGKVSFEVERLQEG